jgi:hypothetical protein
MLFVAILSAQYLTQTQPEATPAPMMNIVEVKGVLPGPGF